MLLLMIAALSKVAGCRRKSLPTWLVSTGYSAWNFYTDGVFLNKISLDKLSDKPDDSLQLMVLKTVYLAPPI